MQRGLLILASSFLGLLLFLAGAAVTLFIVGAPPVRGLSATLPELAPSPTPTTSEVPVAAPPVAASESRSLLEAEEEWLEVLYRTASPSVVNITSVSYSYDFFLNPIPQEGSGSGFIWDEQGHIVTNYHVIAGAQEIEVRLVDGTQVAAQVVGSDPVNDLAVLRVQMGGAGVELPPPLPLGDSLGAAAGQRVVAIGNPFGFDRTLTSGVVSAVGRVIEGEEGSFIGEVIQHDAAINPGNSGGPLLDLDGKVIGVNTQIVSPSGANAGIGFAIPAHTVARVVPELIANGRYPHPWLGFEGVDITPGLAARLRQGGLPLPADEGVLVVAVYRGGPADGFLYGGGRPVRVGNLILPLGGDLIVALDEYPVRGQREMMLYLESEKRVGDPVRVQFWRNGTLEEVTLTLTERP